jgi:hypothetical protein
VNRALWWAVGPTALAALAALNGCGLGGRVNVEPVAVSAQKPGNVALYVSVSQHGAALIGLDKQAFKVFENGVELDNDQIKLTLLPTASSAARRVALLVDMSKTLSPDERKSMADALRPFLIKLRQRQGVSLYAFDGTEKAHLIADYARDARPEPDEKDTSLDRLLSFSRRDSSSSLYTALMDSAQKLGTELSAEGRPIQSGTVVVVALNPDLTGRVDDRKVRDFVEDSPYHYFLLTVGPWATSGDISFIGKNGEARAASINTMSTPLDSVAGAVDDDYSRNYLVSYCSPSRAGTRELRLEVTTHDDQGKPSVGSYETEFDASGFGPGCSPQETPHFVVAKPKTKETPRFAASNKPPTTRPAATLTSAAAALPAPRDNDVKLSSAPSSPKASPSSPIADPPSGLGYE